MSINKLSPLDGRYHKSLVDIADSFSEKALIFRRLEVEVAWLFALNQHQVLPQVLSLSTASQKFVQSLIDKFCDDDAIAIKKLEATTNHDVKALEYWIIDKFQQSKKADLIRAIPAIHFACTSEDINNLAINLQINHAWQNIVNPQFREIINTLKKLSQDTAEIPMLSRTHGQSATPTAVGKEIAIFADRLNKALQSANNIKLSGKLSGASGNYNAHYIACPKVNWEKISAEVIINLGFTANNYTTQIEPHDRISELFLALSLINTIGIDLARDIWGYISFDYFKLKVIKGEVGSSTMPHKVNPIDFENAEGNFGLANALLCHLAAKLPISRFQRDLSDSTVQRNIGSAFGYTVLAWKSMAKGLAKISPHQEKLKSDLDNNWEVLTEAVQTVLRAGGYQNAYDLLKKLSRGKKLNQEDYQKLIWKLPLNQDEQSRLLELTPAKYLGSATNLAKKLKV